ncbi:MAG: hypothetical protein JO020_31090 [Chloroflexi bacterium]|nr:hypothetical protein [Chloroflexota bacterium]MBV9898621.1 hypothetical protein [Chloroflexota bacterium]
MALRAQVFGELHLHQFFGQNAHTLRRKTAWSTPALRSTSASAILSSSAIGFGSSHQDLDKRDENHPMAGRVNSFYTALGTLPPYRPVSRRDLHEQPF